MASMAKLRLAAPGLAVADTRSVKPGPKRADPHYGSAAHRAWAEIVVARAGARCEWVEDGRRCDKSAPDHRMFADHIVERADGGDDSDPDNGQCLCGAHHSLKTAHARQSRTEG